ncbi:MAG TPA: M48 family metallopeptidase, partial [Candidatus Limnocylindrales bacterium]|nr:M48 family metallopeptidase [Candidatus Limnocylindrales bacterium]
LFLPQSKLFSQTGGTGSVVPLIPSGEKLNSLIGIYRPPRVVLAPVERRHKVPEKYDVSKIGSRKIDQGLNFYSRERERAMGKAMAEEIESSCRILNDRMVNDYVNTLGQRLVRNSDAKVPFIIKVVDNDEVNAYALPGGYLYVNTGLILAAQNEAELAGVMAHEIAHVAARHATRNMTRAQLWNIASIPLVFFGGPIVMAVREASSVAFPMTVMKFSRDAEREADLLGIEYEYAAGYDPRAFVDFFERLKAREGKKRFLAKAFATHPMNRDRIKRAQKEIDTMLPPRDSYIVDTSEFDEVQERLLRLMNAKPALGGRPGGPVLRRPSDTPGRAPDGGDKPKLERR